MASGYMAIWLSSRMIAWSTDAWEPVFGTSDPGHFPPVPRAVLVRVANQVACLGQLGQDSADSIAAFTQLLRER